MMGGTTRADFEHCEVGLFLGKNPWHSHSIPRARVTLKAMAKDPARTLVVIDPRVTETAALADVHLQLRPGTDAWLLSAMVAVLFEEDLVDEAFLEGRADGLDAVRAHFRGVDVPACCAVAGIDEARVREVVRRIAGAASFASFEDLGIQMNRNSTVVSYLHRLLWMLTGSFGRPGTHYVPTPLVNFTSGASKRRSPVTEAPIIGGMIPCNTIPEEILTDHPARFRAMLVEAANPAHSSPTARGCARPCAPSTASWSSTWR
jgi:anaerobic selenocysteine-containing dehydrogenase